MKKRMKYIVCISILLIGVLIILLYVTQKNRLPVIREDDVVSITFESNFNDKYEVKNLDINEFIEYYNQISNLVENKEGEGSTATSLIMVKLKSGTTINIGNSGNDFEISVKDNNRNVKQYWGKQHNIRNLLYYGKY